MSEHKFADHAIAWEWKAHPELRRKVHARDAELVRFVLCGDSETEESLDRSSSEYSPAAGQRQSPVRIGHQTSIRRVRVVKDLSPAETKESELIAAVAPVQGNRNYHPPGAAPEVVRLTDSDLQFAALTQRLGTCE